MAGAQSRLVSEKREEDIRHVARLIGDLCAVYGFRLEGDSDNSRDIHVIDLKESLPTGYEWSAFIRPNGSVEIADYVE